MRVCIGAALCIKAAFSLLLDDAARGARAAAATTHGELCPWRTGVLDLEGRVGQARARIAAQAAAELAQSTCFVGASLYMQQVVPAPGTCSGLLLRRTHQQQ